MKVPRQDNYDNLPFFLKLYLLSRDGLYDEYRRGEITRKDFYERFRIEVQPFKKCHKMADKIIMRERAKRN